MLRNILSCTPNTTAKISAEIQGASFFPSNERIRCATSSEQSPNAANSSSQSVKKTSGGGAFTCLAKPSSFRHGWQASCREVNRAYGRMSCHPFCPGSSQTGTIRSFASRHASEYYHFIRPRCNARLTSVLDGKRLTLNNRNPFRVRA